MSDDALFGALSRVATEAGRLVREAAEGAAKELSGALGKDRITFPAGMLGPGPIIPAPYKAAGEGLTWHDAYMASCVVSVAKAVQHHELQPVTTGLVAAQAALHLRPEGYRLLQVGLNSHRVLHHREWRRLATAPALHADLPHLVSNATSLVLEGLPLERRLGSARFLALVASTGLVTQALYLLSTRVAADWLPHSSLANDYYLAYNVGFSGIAMALKVVAGYMREADLARHNLAIPEEFTLTAGRLGAWPSLLLSQYLVPKASLPGHLCGIAAGVLHVYGARLLSWLWRRLRRGGRRLQAGRLQPAAAVGPPPALLDLGSSRHPGLGWMDLGSHALLGAGTCLMIYLSARRQK